MRRQIPRMVLGGGPAGWRWTQGGVVVRADDMTECRGWPWTSRAVGSPPGQLLKSASRLLARLGICSLAGIDPLDYR
jgi:hypothetical protein